MDELPEGQMLFSLSEVGKILKISTWTLRRWIHSGRLTAHKVGDHWRVKREDLETMIDGSLPPEEPHV
jgi:excisionase family DNA binding protein